MLLTEKIIFIFLAFSALYGSFIFGVGGLVYLFFQKSVLKKDYSYKPKVSVLLSSFNEGKTIYETIKSLSETNYPTEKLEILAFDDCSKDDSFEWIEKAANDFSNVIVSRNESNCGKTATQIRAAKMSSGEIVLGVDSDCVFDPEVITELVSCFADEKVAAVGGRVGIKNIEDNFLTKFQTIHYAINFLTFKQLESAFGLVQCLSGPLVAIRKEKYFEVLDEMEKRNFFGMKIKFGEDRALTQFLLRRGYKTLLNQDAVCWTVVPETVDKYIKQQLRWKKSSLTIFFDSVLSLPRVIKNNSVLCGFFGIAPMILLLFSLMSIFKLQMSGSLPIVFIGGILCLIVSSCLRYAIYNLFAKHFLPTDSIQRTTSLIKTSIFSAFWFTLSNLFLTILALCTMDDTGWGTRQITIKIKEKEGVQI